MSMSEEKNPIPFGEPMDYPVLDKISAPEDLRKLPESSLPELARELRHFIVDSVSKTGGHLSSSLGAVELAIALHYVFNTPYDRIVWDVGHQAYAHKILTGRREGMAKLRQLAFQGSLSAQNPNTTLSVRRTAQPLFRQRSAWP